MRSSNAFTVRPKILVYGPFRPPEIACGMTSAVRAFAASRVGDNYDLELISTFRPDRKRSLGERLAFGAWRTAVTVTQMARSGAVLADIHSASDRSFLSHAAVMFGARLAGRPALLRIHGADFCKVFEEASALHRRLIRFILRSATRVVVLSEGWRSSVEKIEPRAVIEIIPNSIDCAAFGSLAIRPPRECRRILFLANFWERKGHFDTLHAISKLVPRFPDLELILAGEDRDPGTQERLEREAEQLGVRRQVQFVGTISGEGKERAVRDADVLILPSHSENMPVSVMEGMAAGLPVISTRVGAIAEMIEDGETGFLIEPRDSDALAERLERLFLNADLGRRLGRNAQRHASLTWDINVVAKGSLALYSKVIEGSDSRLS